MSATAACGHAHSDPERYIRKGDKAYCPKCGQFLGYYDTSAAKQSAKKGKA